MNKEQFLSIAKPKITKVEIPNVGEFHLRTMTAGERAKYESVAFADGQIQVDSFYSELLVRSLCDADGTRWFADTDGNQINSLDAGVIHKLAEAAIKANAMDGVAVDAAKKN